MGTNSDLYAHWGSLKTLLISNELSNSAIPSDLKKKKDNPKKSTNAELSYFLPEPGYKRIICISDICIESIILA